MGAILKHGSERFDFFTKIKIDLKYAHIGSSFKVSGVFDLENPSHRRLFKPLTFPSISIESSLGETLMTGTVVNNSLKSSSLKEAVEISGYSTTGVLEEAPIPIGVYPIEFNGLTLLQIAEKIVKPFGIKVSAENDNGISSEVIGEITARPTQTISQFLSEVASQRNLVLTHNEKGNLLFTRPDTSALPIATYGEEMPATDISLSVNGRALHSEITAFKQASIETDNATESTINNPLIGSFRPTIVTQSTGNDNTAQDFAKNKRASELRGIAINIKSDRWEWLNNGKRETITPGKIITLKSPECFLPKRTRLFVEQVSLIKDEEKETAVITCVLPEVYNNRDPKQIFG